MILARVVGTVVSTAKAEQLAGLKLLLLEKVELSPFQGTDDFVVALDAVGAGVDELVFYVTGSSARMTETSKARPTDATVIAIVDSIDKDGTLVYSKSKDES